MHAGITSAMMGALVLAGGCQAPGLPPPSLGPGGTAAAPAPAAPQTGGAAAANIESAPHADARFLAARGQDVYLVDVRFIDMLDESVIVVRQGAGETEGENRPRIEVPAAVGSPGEVPFSADVWGPVAVEIAETVRRQPGICAGDAEMQLTLRADGEPRTMFRHNRQAWVVFTACPEPSKG